MKLYKIRKKHGAARAAAAVALFVLIAAGLWLCAGRAGEQETRGQLQRVQDALRRAAVNCYAVEGCYPADAAYLEAHYGVRIDHARYAVRYDCIGANVMPDIEVVPVKNGGGGDEK